MSEAQEGAQGGAEAPDAALMSVMAEAQALELASVPKTQEAGQDAPPDFKAQVSANAELIELAWETGADMLPDEIASRYTPEKRQKIAEAYTVVAIKRGWSLDDLMGKWGAEIMLGVALLGPAVPVVVKNWKAKKAREVINVRNQQAAN